MAGETKTSLGFRFGIRSLLFLIALSAVSLFGYQQWVAYKTIENARQWVSNQEAKQYFQVQCPPQVSKEQMIPTLVAGALHLETRYEKTCCLKILAEMFPEECLEALVKIALGSKDTDIQRVAVHLITLKRDVEALHRLKRLAKSPDPMVRAARLDCIGFTRVPTYQQAFFSEGFRWGGPSGEISCSPPIGTAQIFNHATAVASTTFNKERGREMSPSEGFPQQYRHELEQVMLAKDSSQAEREAAARAIVAWPPANYQLRYAEWGVWINSDGDFHLVDSIIEEIPEFVHRTGNSLDSFVERLSIPMIITKPVIHLTCNKPMAIDLDVAFNFGRPWFAYPRPDDFQVIETGFLRLDPSIADLSDSADPNGNPIDVGEGYPWALPRHRQHHTLHRTTEEIRGLGLHWQSAIVSPIKLPWMEPPKVNSDAKFKWWEDLRRVECSWVSSLNESERFIYYDGPTLARSPLDLDYLGDSIELSKQTIFKISEKNREVYNAMEAVDETQTLSLQRDGFYIRVDENGTFGTHVNLGDGQVIDLEKIELSGSDDLQKSLLDCLKNAGLNDQEATALIKCWTPAFFEEPGQRVVFLLHKNEYDLMCPMKIRPQPTELARVGLVLTELID